MDGAPGPPPWPAAPAPFNSLSSSSSTSATGAYNRSDSSQDWSGSPAHHGYGLPSQTGSHLNGIESSFPQHSLPPPPAHYLPTGAPSYLHHPYNPPAPSPHDSRFFESASNSLVSEQGHRRFSLQDPGSQERSQPYPPIRTHPVEWNDGRPGSSAADGLGGAAEDEHRNGERVDLAERASLASLRQQASMLSNARRSPYPPPPGPNDYPSQIPFNPPSNLSHPPDAPPHYYPNFHPLSAPHYQHHHPSILHHSPQQLPMPLGGVPSPSFSQSSFQAQQANARPSSAGEMYNNHSSGYSPPLAHPASFQPQHRHSLPHSSYMPPGSYPPLHTPTSLPNTPPILAATSRPHTAGATAMSSLSLDPVSAGTFRPSSAPPPSDSITAALQLASQNRALYHSGSPVLAYNPAREPSAPTKAIVHRGGVKYAVGTSSLGGKGASGGVVVGTSKAKLAELQASCYSCGTASAKLILRGNDVEFGPRAEFTCLRCLPTDSEGTGSSNVGDVEDQHYSDTLSAAVDQLEGQPVRRTRIITPEQTARDLPVEYKRQAMICDVCDRIIGAGSVKSSYPGQPPAFTSEIICYPCLEKYKPCSDCGGGGGRLTPGRWRCKELFPAGRRTCQLSHARNPPLADIEYDVLSVREIDQEKLDYLTRRCREVYVNTRLRTAARPEMLERADGLATTWEEAEKMTIDQWHLLVPMLYEDIEPTRSTRRYIAYHSSTPHRRRAKPKVKVDPPPEEEHVDKELSGFMILEHDLVHGAVYIAVVMPWAISGDSFEATTILGEQAIQRIRHDLAETNHRRAQEQLPPFPSLRCSWCTTPFRMGSRMTQSLTRRGYLFLEDFQKEYPGEVDGAAFTREMMIPAPYVKALKIFVRRFESDSDLGSSVAVVKKPRVRAKKRKADE